MTRIVLPSLLILALTGCGSEPQGKTSTKLDAVEVQPGTISDSMIILDDASGDGTAVDNSVPSDGTAKPAEKKDAESEDESTASEDDAGEATEGAPAPAAKKAAPTAPAKKSESE